MVREASDFFIGIQKIETTLLKPSPFHSDLRTLLIIHNFWFWPIITLTFRFDGRSIQIQGYQKKYQKIMWGPSRIKTDKSPLLVLIFIILESPHKTLGYSVKDYYY